MTEIKLGDKVKDKATDFTGVAIQRNFTLGQANADIRVVRVGSNGGLDKEWFPEGALEVIDEHPGMGFARTAK